MMKDILMKMGGNIKLVLMAVLAIVLGIVFYTGSKKKLNRKREELKIRRTEMDNEIVNLDAEVKYERGKSNASDERIVELDKSIQDKEAKLKALDEHENEINIIMAETGEADAKRIRKLIRRNHLR